ncbi:hypothetical protein ACJW30_04G171700 [Castanea mollissima]
MAPKRGEKVSAAPTKEKTEKVLNPLFENCSKQFGIGGALPPKRDLHRFVNTFPLSQGKTKFIESLTSLLYTYKPYPTWYKCQVHNIIILIVDATNLFKLLLKYRSEDKSAKKERLLKRAQAEAEGKTNKAQLIVIAQDVDPIELVVWLLALCRKMEIPYCIVKGKSRLGLIVHKKTASVLCLITVKNEDKLEFSKILEAIKANFNDKYDEY